MKQESGRILYVDDEPGNTTVFRYAFEELAIAVENDPLVAIERLRQESFAVLVTDQRMPKMDGLSLARAAAAECPELVILMVTAYTDQSLLLEALNSGVLWRFVRKPWEEGEMRDLLEGALSTARGRELARSAAAQDRSTLKHLARNNEIQASVEEFWDFRSPAMIALLSTLTQAAASDATVLLHGETGTGKEYLARRLHRLSHRAEGPFVAVNCGSIPDELVESELYGHTRGAFTGAHKARQGRFVLAAGGTLFLDEVAELSPRAQATLLRTLQERKVLPVGSDQETEVDLRLIAATHRDLTIEVQAGRFREDLYWRLAQFPLTVPPLRERRSDIIPLLTFLRERIFGRYPRGQQPHPLPDSELKALEQQYREHAWPGNLRELEIVLQRRILTGSTDLALPVVHESGGAVSAPASQHGAAGNATDLDSHLDQLERQTILAALQATGYQLAATARTLGIKRPTLYYRMKKLGLEHPAQRQ